MTEFDFPAHQFLLSPYHDERPPETEVDLLVIHGISLPAGEFATGCIQDLFCGQLDVSRYPQLAELADLRVSAHLLIDRQGQLTQFVPLSKRAWHAGESSFCGRQACNDFSIGIELEGTDDVPYTQAQYERLVQVVPEIVRRYPGITAQHVVGHSDIAPGRKTDPGPAFDWEGFQHKLKTTMGELWG